MLSSRWIPKSVRPPRPHCGELASLRLCCTYIHRSCVVVFFFFLLLSCCFTYALCNCNRTFEKESIEIF